MNKIALTLSSCFSIFSSSAKGENSISFEKKKVFPTENFVQILNTVAPLAIKYHKENEGQIFEKKKLLKWFLIAFITENEVSDFIGEKLEMEGAIQQWREKDYQKRHGTV